MGTQRQRGSIHSGYTFGCWHSVFYCLSSNLPTAHCELCAFYMFLSTLEAFLPHRIVVQIKWDNVSGLAQCLTNNMCSRAVMIKIRTAGTSAAPISCPRRSPQKVSVVHGKTLLSSLQKRFQDPRALSFSQLDFLFMVNVLLWGLLLTQCGLLWSMAVPLWLMLHSSSSQTCELMPDWRTDFCSDVRASWEVSYQAGQSQVTCIYMG